MTGFERDGRVSIWAFREEEDPADVEKDVLKEFCGVDFYDSDFQEGVNCQALESLVILLTQLSYSDSFIDAALRAADQIGITMAFGVVAQFNFEYDPKQVTRPASDDPVFIGAFGWHE